MNITDEFSKECISSTESDYSWMDMGYTFKTKNMEDLKFGEDPIELAAESEGEIVFYLEDMDETYNKYEVIELNKTTIDFLDEFSLIEEMTLTKHPSLEDCLVPDKIKINGKWGTWEQFCKIYKALKNCKR